MSLWAYQWKMSFNLDIPKEAQEVISSKKNVSAFPTPIFTLIELL